MRLRHSLAAVAFFAMTSSIAGCSSSRDPRGRAPPELPASPFDIAARVLEGDAAGARFALNGAPEIRWEATKSGYLARLTPPAGASSFERERSATGLNVTLPEDARDAWSFRSASSSGGGDEVTFTLRDAQRSPFTSEPSNASNRARAVYRELLPSTDAIVAVVDRNAAEWLYVLRDANAPSTFAWSLKLSRSLARVRTARGGGLELVDDRGVAHMTIPRPYAVDANGVHRDLELVLGVADEVTTVTMRLDREGLAFPLVIDPGVVLNRWRRVPIPQGTSPSWVVDAGGGTLLVTDQEGTWLFDGTKWSLASMPISFPNYVQTLVNVGGQVSAVVTDSVDERVMDWTGTDWIARTSPVYPRSRTSPAITVLGSTIVLFGGLSGAFESDTWVWDGSAWSQKTGAHPSARHSAQIGTIGSTAYLYGGFDSPREPTHWVDDLWTWNGATWTQITPTPAGQPTTQGKIVGIPGKLVVVGQAIFDGVAWTPAPAMGLDRAPSTAAFCSFDGKIVIHGGLGGGGIDASRFPRFTDLWTSPDGGTWSKIGEGSPPPRAAGFAFAGAGSWTLLFGGTISSMADPSATLGDTWVFDGAKWTNPTGGPSPGPRLGAVAAPLGGKIIVVGGMDPTRAVTADTWSFDGTAWTLLASGALTPRFGAAMAPYRGGLLLYGGAPYNSGAGLQDTWTFDGTSWSNLSGVAGVGTATYGAMFDVGSRVFLFGGCTVGAIFNGNTCPFASGQHQWEFDGATWQPVATSLLWRVGTTVGPLGGTVSKAGIAFTPAVAHSMFSTWSFDGSAWSEPTITGTVPWSASSASPVAAPLAANGNGVLLFGDATQHHGDTWIYTETFDDGSTCATPADCASGFCVDGFCCDTACAGTCQACSAAKKGGGTDGTCGNVAIGTDPRNDCKDDGSPTCGNDGTCDGSGACRKYASSSGGGCTPRACTSNADCTSGSCADGICCDRACDKPCEACTKGLKGFGVDGVCESASAGTDPRDECPVGVGFPTSCAADGACDGTGLCRAFAPSGTVCGGATCTAGTANGQLCDGSGSCQISSVPCAPFACAADGKSCATTCASDTDCASTAFCSTTNVCVTKQHAGATCGAAKECESTFCVDGVCCDAACTGQCEACGEAGSEGSCTPVRGTPRGKRPACSGDGSKCAGTCDVAKTSECTYPASGEPCGVACANGSETPRACDGTGSCVAGSAKSCGAYECSGDRCGTTCVSDAECANGYRCSAGSCVPGGAHCALDGSNASIAADGTKTDCGAYTCDPSTGQCRVACSTSDDCAPGHSCDATSRTCVPASSGDTSEGGGGCAIGASRGRSGSPGGGDAAWIAFGVLTATCAIVRGRRSCA